MGNEESNCFDANERSMFAPEEAAKAFGISERYCQPVANCLARPQNYDGESSFGQFSGPELPQIQEYYSQMER